jgi:hypothetical protein
MSTPITGALGSDLVAGNEGVVAGAGAEVEHRLANCELRQAGKEATVEERVAEAITRFTGRMRFVYLHLAFFGIWILGPVAKRKLAHLFAEIMSRIDPSCSRED